MLEFQVFFLCRVLFKQSSIQLVGGFLLDFFQHMTVNVHGDLIAGMSQPLLCDLGRDAQRKHNRGIDMPLRYNNDKRKKPLFSRGLSVCRHLFNSFSKLKCDEKIIEKRRLFH